MALHGTWISYVHRISGALFIIAKLSKLIALYRPLMSEALIHYSIYSMHEWHRDRKNEAYLIARGPEVGVCVWQVVTHATSCLWSAT